MKIEKVSSVISIPMENKTSSWFGIFCEYHRYSMLTTNKGKWYRASSRINPLMDYDVNLLWRRAGLEQYLSWSTHEH